MNFLTVEEVAKKLKCTPRSIKKWVTAGDFPPPVRISYTCAIYDEEDIKQWADSRKRRENKMEDYK